MLTEDANMDTKCKQRSRKETEIFNISLHLKVLYGILLINCSATLIMVMVWYTGYSKGQGQCSQVSNDLHKIQDIKSAIVLRHNITENLEENSKRKERNRRSYSAAVSMYTCIEWSMLEHHYLNEYHKMLFIRNNNH